MLLMSYCLQLASVQESAQSKLCVRIRRAPSWPHRHYREKHVAWTVDREKTAYCPWRSLDSKFVCTALGESTR